MPYDHDQIDNLDAVIDGLDDPTTLETWDATDPYDSGMVAASAVRRALAGGGGGSGGLPDWWTVDTDAKTVTVAFPDDPDGDYIGLTIAAPAEFDGFAALQVMDQAAQEFIRVDLAGIRVGLSGDFHTVIGSGSVAIDDRVHDDIVLIATHSNDDDRTQDIVQFYKNSGAAMLWGVNKSGLEYKQNNDFTEPDDADVAANQILEWYDSTENAIAARFKAQDSAGNPFAGKVATMLPDGSAFSGVSKPSVGTADGPSLLAALVTLGLVTDDT